MRWRDAAAYSFAGLLFLASVPLYRFIIERGSRPDAIVPAAAVPSPSPAVVPAALPQVSARVWYAYGEPLPVGYKCSSAGGPVYRTFHLADGSVAVDPLIRDGQVVRCGGDERSSLR